MKLRVKTLKNVEETIEIDESATVDELMKKVELVFPTMPANRQKLIHSGKILKPELRIKNYSDIKDGDKVIVLASKAHETTSFSSEPRFSKPSESKSEQESKPEEPAESRMLVGSELEQHITKISEMGFPKIMVRKAMAAAYNNPDRAVEFLTRGNIPPLEGASPNPQVEPLARHPEQSEGQDAFSQLTTLPMFEQLRQVVQSDPQMLQQILENISQTNPELLQNIIERQDEFLDMINAPSGELDPYAGGNAPNIIQLTETEMASVERLEALGFPRPAVVGILLQKKPQSSFLFFI
ncbi:bifunctional Ubiquitin-like domain/UBA-like superfamily/XPC-binding domain superfamily/UV excision repair protein Rad23/XPC-binding domain/Heat shock chaperonin-binding/Ubiquitin-associated domain/Ubiquitin-like domain superfamily [Babesia duncani]|uniref:UV excision repair protein RAD23 n=1 Tax=Babesia duncani TaxID=323732 RepID=A0AAD9UPE3_9APIC|nr:bifunctional Ubiquitin-like domain/UBA-like superfamily/XPC-binding domain superfamily/UV excision repair protein Rad23/XPC-binding domain/Heat shock chaperonin-binding/Ubiquitin-associated domain/Ubiquitin-like domain superfamily [Babesia duncani]